MQQHTHHCHAACSSTLTTVTQHAAAHSPLSRSMQQPTHHRQAGSHRAASTVDSNHCHVVRHVRFERPYGQLAFTCLPNLKAAPQSACIISAYCLTPIPVAHSTNSLYPLTLPTRSITLSSHSTHSLYPLTQMSLYRLSLLSHSWSYHSIVSLYRLLLLAINKAN